MNKEEHIIQSKLIEWTEDPMIRLRWPELYLLYSIPNGGYRISKGMGIALKKEGLKAGMPDLHLPVARGKFHSLYIEMKTPKGPVRKVQKKMHRELRAQGNAVVVCRSANSAANVLVNYLDKGVVPC